MKSVQRAGVQLLLRYLSDRPLEKLPKMFDLAEKLDPGKQQAQKIQAIRSALLDEDSNWRRLTENLFQEVDKRVIRKLMESFMINANLFGLSRKHALEEKYDCNIPWAILMDPTSACNLSCIGCWAGRYEKKNNLSYETLDSICRQGKELGVHFYIFSGGEPLVRRKDIIRLCEAHQDCYFFAFTNGTLVDDELCREMLRVGNFALAFSIEGDEEATDMRRGKGTYRKVIAAMERMKEYGLLFGCSTCYHRYNTESIASDEFVNDMIARGCRFMWNFTYMPVGREARTDFLATPEQRAYMYRRIREIRETKPIFAIDFWNDGEYTGGCIAGGRQYLHINAAGDVEPCAFIHYSNVNIHQVSLLEALRSPLFMAYRRRQPFNDNHLRPCPLLDNPEALAAMVKESGAHSTDLEAPEEVDSLCAKTVDAARRWAPTADRLWEERCRCRAADRKEERAMLSCGP
ncbi:MAG TPA: radical SAM protein [Bacillota bacterium]|nr:radical SAM protein [Bacillota bacterium]HQD05939.1 radical SAM protein [Bacillota bacterium]